MQRLQALYLPWLLCFILLLSFMLVPARVAQGQSESTQAVLERFFSSETAQADWFTDAFLAQVPLTRIETIRQQIATQLGDFQQVEGTSSPFTVHFAQGTATVTISLDDAGKIAGLRITNVQPAATPNATSAGTTTPATETPSTTPANLTPKAALERLFTSSTIESAWFTDAFLAQVSPSDIETQIAKWLNQLGAFEQIEGDASPFTVRFAQGSIPAEITLDSNGRIAGLFFHPPIPAVENLQAAVAQFTALPGDVNLLVLRDNQPIAAHNAEAPLAVGSAFKLAVLAALQEQIKSNTHAWDEVVRLDPTWKSLPSGILQNWPAESPLTLHTLATLMISISDNTAADTLLHMVGREAVETYSTRNHPFLTTQETFKLKVSANANLLERYQAGDDATKRQLLDELDAQPLPPLSDFPSTPTLDIEWFFNASELCDLMAQVKDLDVMSVSSGPAISHPAPWARIAYKGGSELGVINLTYWLESQDGTAYCVTATQNRSDAAVDEIRFFGLTSALIGTLTSTVTSTVTATGTALPTATGLQTPTTTATSTVPAETTLTPTATPAATTTATAVITAAASVTATAPLTVTRPQSTTTSPTTIKLTTPVTPLVFANVRLFDGEQVISSTNVVVENGLITAVGPMVEQPPGAEVIDGSGKTLLPGLIDAHTHVFSAEALRQALVFGVTTEMDMFMDYKLAAQLRQQQAANGAVDRADLFSAGTLATAPGGHGTQFGLDIPTLTNPDEAASFVQDRIAEGSDYIKIIVEDGSELGLDLPTLDEATVAALVKAAHQHGKLTLTHVQTIAAAREALNAGSDGLAHIFVDAVADPAFITQAVQSHLFVISTLSVFQSIGSEPVDLSVMDDPYLSPYLTAEDLQSLKNPYHGYPGLSRANGEESIRLLFHAGVPILAGTDSPNPGTIHGASLHRELVLLTDAGLSPIEVLRAATSVTADIFDLQDRGRVAPGLRADLLLVNGDPTQEITATRNIAGVWKLGVPVDQSAYLKALEVRRLAAAAQRAVFEAGDVALVSDFESQSLTTTFGADWTISTDQMAGGDSTASLQVVADGANGSNYSLAVTGEVASTVDYAWAGAIFMPGATPFAPFDLSSKSTLHFWAKAEAGSYHLQLFCANLGQVPAQLPLDLTSEWQAFSVDMTSLNGCDTTGVEAIVFSEGSAPGPFKFQVDEVSFQN